jgi:hypothetical protein
MSYYPKYRDQFTIRKSRPSGIKSELDKILEGWGDYFFYGFGSNDGHIYDYKLCDLSVFRDFYSLMASISPPGYSLGEIKKNGDRSSVFEVFEYACFPSGFVIASSDESFSIGWGQGVT